MYKQPVFQLSARDTIDQIVKRVRDNGQARRQELFTQQEQQAQDPQFTQSVPEPQQNIPYQQTQPMSGNVQQRAPLQLVPDLQPTQLTPDMSPVGAPSFNRTSPFQRDNTRTNPLQPITQQSNPQVDNKFAVKQPAQPARQELGTGLQPTTRPKHVQPSPFQRDNMRSIPKPVDPRKEAMQNFLQK